MEIRITAINPFREDNFDWDQVQQLDSYGGLIVMGSSTIDLTVEDKKGKRNTYIERASGIVNEALKRDLPMLGICLGQQFMVQTAGGVLKANPHQAEFGTTQLSLTPEGKEDYIFQNIRRETNENIHMLFGHKDSVKVMPQDFKILAVTQRDQQKQLTLVLYEIEVVYHIM